MAKAGAFGMPRRMPGSAFIACIARAAPLALAGALLITAPAAAQDFCAGLRAAMAHAIDDFESLKIPGEYARAGAAAARTLLPDGQRCEVRRTTSIVEYRCRTTRLDAPPSEARAAFRQGVAQLRRCFTGVAPRGEGDYTAQKEWTGAVIWDVGKGLRAAVVYFAAEEIANVADRGDDEDVPETATWIVVEKRRR